MASAATTINGSSSFTIDDTNTTKVGTLTTWNETGTLTIHGDGTLQTWPTQNTEVANNAPIVFAGTGGTITLRFNGNDAHFTLNGPITSTATGAQTLDVYTGYNANGDRASVTFYSGIPNVGDGSPMSLRVTYRTQTGQPSYVSLPGLNTFTGPLTLVKGSAVTTSYLTVGGVRTKSGSTPGTGKLGGGSYPGNITLGDTTIFNYLSSANQILSGAISGTGAVVVGGGGTVTLSGASTFSGNATVSSGSALVLASSGDYKFVVTDSSTNKITGGGSATLNGAFTIDTSAVTVNSGSWTLVDTSTKSFGAAFQVNGFSDADLDNIWTKSDGPREWSFNEATGVLSAGPVAVFTSFGIPGNPAIIDNDAKTVRQFVPLGTNLATLAPNFTVSSGTCNQTSGSTPSPTFAVLNPATYTITDGGVVNVYTVTVQSYDDWAHSGSLFILTTPDGANLPADASETNFPLLVRFNSSNFNFGEAQSDGSDIRFTTAAGTDLLYQIEEWNAVAGTASIWVKIPVITGNTRQEIKMYWGMSGVPSRSNGAGVFSAANGYASVIHLADTLSDVIGTTTPTNVGTTVANGLIGRSRTFASGQGIQCGTAITGLPTGSGPFSTGIWIRPAISPSDILGWGLQESSAKKVVIQLASPPHINLDCWFGGAGITGTASIPTSEWTYVVHTFQTTGTRLYLNGVLDATNNGGTMNLQSPCRFDIGGWSGTYNFVGDMDEVRISNVVRSANWVKLEYENQRPQQTLVGSLVQPGDTFSVAPTPVTFNEGTSTTLTGQAGGAQKVYWIYKKDGQETVLAVDRLSLDISAGRVTGNQNYTIQFKGVYPTEIRTVDIPVTVTETIPDPEFTLNAPSTWNGRDTITVTPVISNLAAMQAAGADSFNYNWKVDGVAVISQIVPGVLTLLRSQGSGPMTVTLTMDNGGGLVTNTKIITVQEPASDAWVQRSPGATEKPVDNQFFARDDTGFGTIHYNGTQVGTPDDVFLKIYTTDGGDVLYATHRQSLAGNAYAFSVPIAAGKVTYKVVYGTRTGGIDTPLATVSNLVCGDAYLIEGQSNALATDNIAPNDFTTDPWIRTYGKTLGWGGAISKGSEMQLGLWGWYLANYLSGTYAMPICIINGAKGGTRVDQHMPNPTNHSLAKGSDSIYADLYNRLVGGNLTHGIRGVIWHQGEQDQGAGGPDGDYDYKFYQQYFVDMTAAWKQDFPNIKNYYVFQIWPAACGDQSRNDQLREAQRTLAYLYSNMKMMSTLGIVPGSSCHYEPAGYQVFSNRIAPLIEQDRYGVDLGQVWTAANLKKAWFTTGSHNEIALEFDQNMAWNPGAPGLIFLDGVAGKVSSGSASGKVIKLQLSASSTAATITYLMGKVSWNQPDILYGSNGIAALTFADVPIAEPTAYSSWIADPAQGLTAGVNDGPLDDPDSDNIVNLLEFVLGGHPLVSSSATLPTLSKNGGGIWSFGYERGDLSLPPATTQVVEYGSNLGGWTEVIIPATSAGSVTITPGSPSDHVRVAIPDLGAAGFARLKIIE